MRVNNRWLVIMLLLVTIPALGCGFINKLRARDALNKGVKAFTEQKFNEAAKFFEQAIEMDQTFEVARMYLATSYTSQFIPGSPDPASLEMANKAIATFEEVVKAAETTGIPNYNAMLSIASLYYQLGKTDDSKNWCNRILKQDPNNAEAYYRIAVIDYDSSLSKTGLQGENVEFLSPEEQSKTKMEIDEGLKALDQALKIRADYFDGMEYQNLLWREKAKFEKDATAKAELIKQADSIAQKSLELRLKAQEEAAKAPKKMVTK
jgi:tetratricopeptide (TPR) repeat protein